jgi:uncharacterized protein YdhG (YjbR/CyaY superfamily)
MTGKPKNIDEYLAVLSEDKRAALEKLRQAIKSIAPAAEEYFYYQLPAFRLHGKRLVAFGAAKDHCSFYPLSAAVVQAHADDLKHYDTSPGTIRFPADKPLPTALVRKIVKFRIAENEAKSKRRR